jgi:hypothetical protein
MSLRINVVRRRNDLVLIHIDSVRTHIRPFRTDDDLSRSDFKSFRVGTTSVGVGM